MHVVIDTWHHPRSSKIEAWQADAWCARYENYQRPPAEMTAAASRAWLL